MTLQEYLDRFFGDCDKVHLVVHGDATTTVPTESGTIKSLAKVVSDLEASFNAATTGTLALATEKANDAAQSAEDAADQVALLTPILGDLEAALAAINGE